jgi:hypothetical protein
MLKARVKAAQFSKSLIPAFAVAIPSLSSLYLNEVSQLRPYS